MKKILLAIIVIAALGSCKKEEGNGRLAPGTTIAINAGSGVKSDDNPEHCTAGQIVEWTWALSGKGIAGAGFDYGSRDFVNNRLLMRSDFVISDRGELDPTFIESRDIVLTRSITNILDRTYYYPYLKYDMDIENKKLLVIVYDPAKDSYDPPKEVEDLIVDEIPWPEGYTPTVPNTEPDWKYNLAINFVYTYSKYKGFVEDTMAYIPNRVVIEAERAIKEAYAKEDYAECYRLFDQAFTFYPITGPEWRALKAQEQE